MKVNRQTQYQPRYFYPFRESDMKTVVYNKLVRDKIPEIIHSHGKTANCAVMPEEEYVEALETKLSEELEEYLAGKEPEELADLLEVFYALLKARGIPFEDLERIRAEKAEQRGGFEKRIKLISVEESAE